MPAICRTNVAVIGRTAGEAGRNTVTTSGAIAPFMPAEYCGVDGQLIKRLGAIAPPWPLGWCPSMVFNQPAVEEGKVLAKKYLTS